MSSVPGAGTFNGASSGGMTSKFPIPDAPMYMEFARTLSPGPVSLMQFWTKGCFDQIGPGTCFGDETDIDMGQFNGCNQFNVAPGASPQGLCSGMFVWNGSSAGGFFNGSVSGSVPVDGDTNPHVIMLQRLPDPAPNGTVRYGADGGWVKTVSNMPDDRWIYPSRHLQSGSWGALGSPHDALDLDLFCSNGNGCSYPMSIAWRYIRVYTPSGLPNGY
jgi:hypothetical protein